MRWARREDFQVGLDRREDVTLQEGEDDKEDDRLPELKDANLVAIGGVLAGTEHRVVEAEVAEGGAEDEGAEQVDGGVGVPDPPGGAQGEEDAGKQVKPEHGGEAVPRAGLGEGGPAHQVHVDQLGAHLGFTSCWVLPVFSV